MEEEADLLYNGRSRFDYTFWSGPFLIWILNFVKSFPKKLLQTWNDKVS